VNRTWLIITLVGILPAAAIGFLVGSIQPEPPEVESVVVEPEPVDFELPDLNQGPREPGRWAWSELRGGECISFFTDAFAEKFTVVPCATPHEAEFVRATIVDSNPASPYPGDTAIEEFAAELCRDWGQEDLVGGEAFDDLVAEASFSLGEDSWIRGDRLAGCFVRQLDGELFTARLVVQ
jgi:hypothetical protein